MNSLKTPKPLLAARMAFPLAASLITVLLGEWIARGALTADTVTSFIFPHAEAYLLAWLFLFLVWLLLPPTATSSWVTRGGSLEEELLGSESLCKKRRDDGFFDDLVNTRAQVPLTTLAKGSNITWQLLFLQITYWWLFINKQLEMEYRNLATTPN